jgi:hypothetical protein
MSVLGHHAVVPPAAGATDAVQAHACALVDAWRTLSPADQELIVTLVVRWAARDRRAGIGLVHPTTRSA